MALSSTIVWEVRSAGNDNNGGGYKTGASGTDYSQQNAAQYALTNVTTSGVTAILLSATAAADMVGNIAHVVSGTNFIAGFYEILSVSVGVSITLDATCATGVGATGVVNIGGALATIGKIGSASANQGMVAGNYCHVKGSFTLAATDTIACSGTSTSPIVIKGYGIARGDGYLGRTNGNGALITTNMPSVSYNAGFGLTITGGFVIIEAMNFSCNISGVAVTNGADGVMIHCKSLNISSSAAVKSATCNTRGIVYGCDLTLTGSSASVGLSCNTSFGRLIANRVTVVATAPCISCQSSTLVLWNICFTGGGSGISMTSNSGAVAIIGNTIVGCTGDGINVLTGTTGLQCIVGNLVTDNLAYGINMVSAANAAFLASNRTRDNTSGAINLGTDWASATSYEHVTTDTGGAETDYVNSGSNDYRLIGTSPARGVGVPAYASIGALQPQGGGIFRHPGMTGGYPA